MRKEKNTIKLKSQIKLKKRKKVINKFLAFIIIRVLLASCATTDIMPKRKTCTGENKTLADLVCKKINIYIKSLKLIIFNFNDLLKKD